MSGPDQDPDNGPITGINVTPLVDITLVLLIVFMVTATYIVAPSIPVNLPRAATGDESTPSTLALVLTKDGALYLNGQPSSEKALVVFASEELKASPQLQAVISADKEVPHGKVVHLIDVIRAIGVTRFAINVEREE